MNLLTHVDEAHVELPGGVPPLQVTAGVDVVVPDDTSDQVGGGDPLGTLGGHEHP